jgi:hypothetical protein
MTCTGTGARGEAGRVIESNDTSFSAATRHRLIEDFVVSYYNGTLKPNLAEKSPTDGRDVEYLMDGPQFEKIRRAEIWSYSNAVGTGYRYRVVYKDRRFSDMERLVGIYSGSVPASGEDRSVAEQSLYQLILLLIKEGRLPKNFKIQSAREESAERMVSMVEELGRSLDELGRRVRMIEEQLAIEPAPKLQNDPQPVS